MPIFGGPSPLESDIEKATNESLISENWPLVFDICDKVKSGGESGCKDCIKCILKRLQHKNPRVVYYTLIVLEACANNCGKPFLLHVSSREFCHEIQNLITSKTQPKIRNKILFLIKTWHDQNKEDPQFSLLVDLYRKLKDRSDIHFPSEATIMSDQFSPTAPSAPVAPKSSTDAAKEEDDIAKAIALSLKESTPTPPVSQTKSSSSLYASLSSSAMSDAPKSFPTKENRKVRALYDFEAAEDNELTFKAGEVIILLDDSDQNWWKGENHRGQGLFPAHFVSLNLDTPVDSSETTSSSTQKGVGFTDEVRVIEYTPQAQSQPMIDESKIKRALEYLHSADPTGETTEPQDMLDMEADCYAMGPLIDTELENIDREHLQLTELNKKLMDAFSLYNKLMKQAPVVVNYNVPPASFNPYPPNAGTAGQPQQFQPSSMNVPPQYGMSPPQRGSFSGPFYPPNAAQPPVMQGGMPNINLGGATGMPSPPTSGNFQQPPGAGYPGGPNPDEQQPMNMQQMPPPPSQAQQPMSGDYSYQPAYQAAQIPTAHYQ